MGNSTYFSMCPIKIAKMPRQNMVLVVLCPALFITLVTTFCFSLFEYSTSDLNLGVK